MTPSVAPTAEVEIGGQTRHLRYTFRALRAIEKALPGTNALTGLSDLLGEMNAERALVFIWAGLLHEDPALTQGQVEDWLDIPTFARIVEQLKNAFGEGGEPQPQMDPTPAA